MPKYNCTDLKKYGGGVVMPKYFYGFEKNVGRVMPKYFMGG